MRNPQRRQHLVDAALQVLAREGSRGLSHRAVDAEAGLPQGTCVNYYRSRDDLYGAMGERIFERLLPSDRELRQSAEKPASRARYVELMHELMERVLEQPEMQIALWELRLESTRRPELREALSGTLRDALAVDLDFHHRAGLPGGEDEVVMLHLAFEGLILNLITLPEVLEVGRRQGLVEELVLRLIPPGGDDAS